MLPDGAQRAMACGLCAADCAAVQAVGAAVGGLSSGRGTAGHAPPSQVDVERIAGVADDALRLADLGIAAGLNGGSLCSRKASTEAPPVPFCSVAP